MLSGIELVAIELGFERKSGVEPERCHVWCTICHLPLRQLVTGVCLNQLGYLRIKKSFCPFQCGIVFQSVCPFERIHLGSVWVSGCALWRGVSPYYYLITNPATLESDCNTVSGINTSASFPASHVNSCVSYCLLLSRKTIFSKNYANILNIITN